MQSFKINDSFTIIPATNMVVSEAKLEPRLMKLLLLLAENNGKLVSREEIIEKLWDNYGGGDDGLTQAISFLRKVLNDTDKKIIETVPKGGYIFNGRIEVLTSVESVVQTPATGNRTISIKTAGLIAVLLIGIFAFILYYISSTNNYAPKPAKSYENAPAENAPKP